MSCANHPRREAKHRLQARYWWGKGPAIYVCRRCAAMIEQHLVDKSLRTRQQIDIDCCGYAQTRHPKPD